VCGFAGVLTAEGSTREELESLTARMTASLIHRGPDDDGIWIDPESGVGFGFRRLAIVELSAHGHQPMQSASGRFTIVFNGEIYNHGDLRPELEAAGYRFRGRSDTETILAAVEHFGLREAVRRFVGMFAIALWDAQERTLSLVRDRLGIKPLFVSRQGPRILFGSELKALLAVPEFDRTIDVDAVAAYLRYRYVPAPMSVFRGTRKLLPGHILTLRVGTSSIDGSAPYWSVAEAVEHAAADPFAGSGDEADAALETLVSDAVRLRLQADVPVGALLSGGIDSSLVVALAQQSASFPLKTFCVGFDSAEHDEAAAAAAVARHLGTDHIDIVVTGADARAVIPRLPSMFDEPLANASQIPTYLVCELARRQVTVALSGDGGDEIMAGYHRYLQGSQLITRMRRVPHGLRRMAAAGISAVPSAGWNRGYGMVSTLLPRGRRHRLPAGKIAKVGHLLGESSDATMYRSLLSAWQDPCRFLRGTACDASPVDAALERFSGLPLFERMMATDQVTYLPDDLLAKVDRASMAVSLELRVPLLDHRVVEYAWRLDRSHKVEGSRGKRALRRILYRHVPRELVDRPKTGFTVPLGEWLAGPLRDWAGDILVGSQDDLLDSEAVAAAWQEFRRGEDHLADGLWTLLQFKAWRMEWNV